METQDKKNDSGVIAGIVGILIGLTIGFNVNSPAVGSGLLKMSVIGLTGSLLTFFLEFCYRPGNIFGWYYEFIEKHFRDNPKNPFGFLFNPLGGCMYCQNVWLTTGLFIVGNIYFEVSFWLMLPAILLSHLMLNILDREFWR